MSGIPQRSLIMSLEPYVDASGQRARQATADILASNDATPAVTEEASPPRRSSFLEQDQGVLMDVLEELDKERHKRAELEAKVRILEQELHVQKKKNSKSAKTSVRDYSLVKAERDGYKELLDAITQDRPAFSTYSASNQQQRKRQPQSLPIHIVRLLEVMPWDSRAQQYTFGQEEVYEWQIYSADKNWQKELRYFPTLFKTLPIVVPTPGKTMLEEAPKSQPYFGTSVSPPKQCVLTDLEGTTILNTDKGYPLPNDGGGWAWVGPWTVEKNNDTDEEGWSYSNDIEIMSHISTYHGDFRVPEIGTANITKRRRKWTRARTLTDYPYASNMTREYLKLIAEKSRLDASVEKLSGQLVDTKMCLTTLEAEKEQTDSRLKQLEQDLQHKNEALGLTENEAASESADNVLRITDGSQSSDSASKGKEIRSAVNQWVSNTIQKSTKGDSNSTEANGDQGSHLSKLVEKTLSVQSQLQKQNDTKQQLFENLREKGTGFLDILKPKGEQK